jgi:hypothetical protein
MPMITQYECVNEYSHATLRLVIYEYREARNKAQRLACGYDDLRSTITL